MRLLIYGSGDFAPTVVELAQACGYDLVGLIDDVQSGPRILGNFESVRDTHPPADHGVVLAIGYNNLQARWAAWQRVLLAGYRTPALIHPRAYVADSATIAKGSMVMACAVVDVRAKIEEAVVLWPGACVNHDTVIGANCFISPNATVCGFVQLGANSFVGAGSVIADRCAVPPSSFVKMLSRYSERPK